jgi:stage V sporulation protein AE
MFFSDILLAFLAGGFICVLAQILIDKTSFTPARILVGTVCLGVFLFAIGIYEPLFDIFGCGISVPLIGFGAVIGKGVKEAVDSFGALGILSGGLTASSVGITSALLLAVLTSLITKGRSKRL